MEKLSSIQQTVLEKLKSKEGKAWKEVHGELHVQFDEMPNWILLYDDSNPAEAHRQFSEIVEPHLEEISPVQVTVKYTILHDDHEVILDFFSDNDEIIEAAQNPDSVGRNPDKLPRKRESVFESKDSRRE